MSAEKTALRLKVGMLIGCLVDACMVIIIFLGVMQDPGALWEFLNVNQLR